MIVTLLISFGLPIALMILGRVKYKKSFSFIPMLAGILGFFISQILFRLPLIQAILPLMGWYKQFMQSGWPYVLFLSFTAGLVEEPARFVAFTIMKKRRRFTDGLSYGIGHGGIEAILLIGMTYISNLVLSMMINSSALVASSTLLPASVITALTGTSPWIFLAAGIERIFAVSLQIALSLLVLKGFQLHKKALYLTLAIVIHGLANFLALVFTQLGKAALPSTPELGSVLFSEGFLLIIGVLLVLCGLVTLPPLALQSNPPVVKEPNWDSQQTRALAVRACFDCHSNQTNWPWFTKVPPGSWLAVVDMVRGRNHLNFSTWGVPQSGFLGGEGEREGGEGGGRGGRGVARAIENGSMPPGNYLMLHPEASLSPQEKQQLIDGLQKSLQ
jgi:uncharacterized membrane protein YhfC